MGNLICNDINRKYRGRQALRLSHLEISDGRTVVLGRNGAGKTTLFRALSTLEQRHGDRISFDGQVVSRRSNREYRRHLGWLPQQFAPPPTMSALSFVEYVAWLKQVPRRQRRSKAMTALDRVGMADRADDRIGELSGGMARRVGIAQALVNDPSVLLLDEPTAGLDPGQQSKFGAMINAIDGSCVVLVATHSLEDVLSFGEELVLLDGGQARFHGSISDFTSTPEPTLGDLRQAFEAFTTGEA